VLAVQGLEVGEVERSLVAVKALNSPLKGLSGATGGQGTESKEQISQHAHVNRWPALKIKQTTGRMRIIEKLLEKRDALVERDNSLLLAIWTGLIRAN